MTRNRAAVMSFLLCLAGCSDARIEDYAAKKPALDIRHFLNGHIEAWGVYRNRSGMVDQQFHVVMKGSWQGNDGTLEESFTYDDGHTDERVWSIHFVDDHHFTASAHDVVGQAKGAQYGNAMNMGYLLRVPVKDSTYDIRMDDWMYLMDEHTLINHTTMTKFGFKVGDLLITFRKK